MRDYILQHWKRYPAMEIQDLVKLIYQNEFGGGHMITDRAASLGRLQKECLALEEAGAENALGGRPEPKFENIGNGLCRLYLHGAASWLQLQTINDFFVNTAQKTEGSTERFYGKLEEARELCLKGELPFTGQELEDYLVNYKRMGCPAVSHSEAYRKNYHPAYRIVGREYERYWRIFSFIDKSLEASGSEKPLLIGVDGKSGSGKSFLGQLLNGVYDCSLFHMDDFFLRPEQRTKERLSEIGGNVDYERFQEEVLKPVLSREESFSYQTYDCCEQRLTGTVKVERRKINIVEGSYCLHPYFGDPYDYKIFLDIGEEEQINRIRERNGERMLGRFLEEWIPKENAYFLMQERRGISYESYYSGGYVD